LNAKWLSSFSYRIDTFPQSSNSSSGNRYRAQPVSVRGSIELTSIRRFDLLLNISSTVTVTLSFLKSFNLVKTGQLVKESVVDALPLTIERIQGSNEKYTKRANKDQSPSK
jgi:hypothetical protein